MYLAHETCPQVEDFLWGQAKSSPVCVFTCRGKFPEFPIYSLAPHTLLRSSRGTRHEIPTSRLLSPRSCVELELFPIHCADPGASRPTPPRVPSSLKRLGKSFSAPALTSY